MHLGTRELCLQLPTKAQQNRAGVFLTFRLSSSVWTSDVRSILGGSTA